MYTNEELLSIFEKEMRLSLRKKEENTITLNLQRVKRFSDTIEKPLLSVQQLDIKQYIMGLKNLKSHNWQEDMKDSAKTVNLSSIKNFYNIMYASDDPTIIEMRNSVNPVANIKGAVYSGESKNASKKQDAFTQEQLFDLFSAIKSEIEEAEAKKQKCKRKNAIRDYAFFMLLFNTGFRVSELTNLKFENIDFDTREVKAVNTKTDKDRIVKISPTTLSVLEDYLKVDKREIRDDNYVFGNQKVPMARSTMDKRLKEYGKKVGIDEELLHNHTFRHTCATILYNQSKDFNIVKDTLGHETIITSERYVSSDDLKKKAMEEQVSIFEDVCSNIIAS